MSMSSPRLAPLQINKRTGANSPGKSHRPRVQSDTSTASQSSLQSLASSTYPDSASAAHIAASFIAEVDSWILEIRQQLDELEERHEKHKEWLANGGADDLDLESEIQKVRSKNRDLQKLSGKEKNGNGKGAGENNPASSGSLLSSILTSLSSVRQNAETTHRDS